MISLLLPPCVQCAECRGDDPTARLFPEEIAQLGHAVEARVKEYATARTCARRALSALGVAPQPVLQGSQREPQWPRGYVGSITHCEGYRAAAVARHQDILAIGIDAELNQPLPEELLDIVMTPAERLWVATAPEGVHWDRLIFSAKESVYKSWFPLTRTWLGFDNAFIKICVRTGTFRVQLSITAQNHTNLSNYINGKFRIIGHHIMTATVVYNTNQMVVST